MFSFYGGKLKETSTFLQNRMGEELEGSMFNSSSSKNKRQHNIRLMIRFYC
jgi:hypothetical protein